MEQIKQSKEGFFPGCPLWLSRAVVLLPSVLPLKNFIHPSQCPIHFLPFSPKFMSLINHVKDRFDTGTVSVSVKVFRNKLQHSVSCLQVPGKFDVGRWRLCCQKLGSARYFCFYLLKFSHFLLIPIVFFIFANTNLPFCLVEWLIHGVLRCSNYLKVAAPYYSSFSNISIVIAAYSLHFFNITVIRFAKKSEVMCKQNTNLTSM